MILKKYELCVLVGFGKIPDLPLYAPAVADLLTAMLESPLRCTIETQVRSDRLNADKSASGLTLGAYV
jgi:hypothetical protein